LHLNEKTAGKDARAPSGNCADYSYLQAYENRCKDHFESKLSTEILTHATGFVKRQKAGTLIRLLVSKSTAPINPDQLNTDSD